MSEEDYDRPFWVNGILHRLDKIIRKVDAMSDNQTHLDADVRALVQSINDIESEVAALKAQPKAEELDFSALDAVVARVQGDVTPVAAAASDPAVVAAADQPVVEAAPAPAELADTPAAQAAAAATGDASVFTPVEDAPQPVSDVPVADTTPVEAPVEEPAATDANADEATAPAEDAPAEATAPATDTASNP